MKALLLAALLLAPARLLAWGGHPRTVLLAVPGEDFSQWRALAGVFGSYSDLRLTLALTPAMMTPQVRDTLSLLTATGRLEFAMRLPGDPILPLVRERSGTAGLHDSLSRIASAREHFRSVLSSSAALGFVPGGGAATADLTAMLRSMSVPWLAVGPAAPAAAPRPEAPAFLPFAAVRSDGRSPSAEDLTAAADGARGIGSSAGAGRTDFLTAGARGGAALAPDTERLVLDEAGGLVPRGSFLALLQDLAQKRPDRRWATVSQSLESDLEASSAQSSPPPAPEGSPPEPAPASDWPGWGAGSWTGTPASEAAWKAYGDTAGALARYQNSGVANLKALESATEALHAAQASRYYRLLASASPGPDSAAADRSLRQQLMAVYRRIKQPVPGSLYAPFLAQAADAGAEVSEDVPTDVRGDHGANWLSFQNPLGSMSRAWDGKSSPEPWKILGLRVEWDEASVVFSYRMAALDASTSAPRGPLGRLVLDTYVDINHVPGAGNRALLEGRASYAANPDCWEYALSLGPDGGAFFRAIPDSEPAALGRIPVTVDPAAQTIRAVVPRAWLRGQPLRWGYIVASFAAKPLNVAPTPGAAAAVLPGGPLGILAPLEQQKSPSAGQRLNAVRVSR